MSARRTHNGEAVNAVSNSTGVTVDVRGMSRLTFVAQCIGNMSASGDVAAFINVADSQGAIVGGPVLPATRSSSALNGANAASIQQYETYGLDYVRVVIRNANATQATAVTGDVFLAP
jgi:hypothetical protein